MKVCDCGQIYSSEAGLLSCQASGHAGAAELELADALAGLSPDELVSPAELRRRELETKRALDEVIAAGLAVPAELVSADLAEVSYRSARSARTLR